MTNDAVRDQLEKLIPQLLEQAPKRFNGSVTPRFIFQDGHLNEVEIIYANVRVMFNRNTKPENRP